MILKDFRCDAGFADLKHKKHLSSKMLEHEIFKLSFRSGINILRPGDRDSLAAAGLQALDHDLSGDADTAGKAEEHGEVTLVRKTAGVEKRSGNRVHVGVRVRDLRLLFQKFRSNLAERHCQLKNFVV